MHFFNLSFFNTNRNLISNMGQNESNVAFTDRWNIRRPRVEIQFDTRLDYIELSFFEKLYTRQNSSIFPEWLVDVIYLGKHITPNTLAFSSNSSILWFH